MYMVNKNYSLIMASILSVASAMAIACEWNPQVDGEMRNSLSKLVTVL